MDIDKSGNCRLSLLEEKYTGLPNPVYITDINTSELLDGLDAEAQGIEARQAADDDDLTHAERAAIVPDAARLRVKKEIITVLIGQVMAWQVEHSQAS